MPRAATAAPWKEMTLEERRERRRLRREKQREDNVKRAAKMHVASAKDGRQVWGALPELKQSVHVGYSGWRYWKWRNSFYAGAPQTGWFGHYLKHFDTSKSTLPSTQGRRSRESQAWRRQPGKKKFIYTVKVSEHITHIKRFKGKRRSSGILA
jgi:hypothetical protein